LTNWCPNWRAGTGMRKKTGSSAPAQGPAPGGRPRTDRSVYWILAGLVVTGILAGYNWLRSLPKD
jgi:hypothetical protein